MKTIFAVYENADKTEGRGPTIINSLWDDKEEAIKFMDEQPGVMGNRTKWSEVKYGDWHIQEIPVFSKIEEKLTFEKQEQIKKALNKLTPDERKLLGY